MHAQNNSNNILVSSDHEGNITGKNKLVKKYK